MSYSISARGKTKTEALADLAKQFDAITHNMPVHERDRSVALHTAAAMCDLLEDGQGRDVVISLSGSLGWNSTNLDGTPNNINSAAVAVQANYDWQQAAQYQLPERS